MSNWTFLKTKEMFVRSPRTRYRVTFKFPHLGLKECHLCWVLPGCIRGESVHSGNMFNVLGASMLTRVSMPIRTLRAHGLGGTHLWNVTRATIVCLYDLCQPFPGWVCLTRSVSAVPPSNPHQNAEAGSTTVWVSPPWWCFSDAADTRVFAAILGNPHHVLHRILPPVREST